MTNRRILVVVLLVVAVVGGAWIALGVLGGRGDGVAATPIPGATATPDPGAGSGEPPMGTPSEEGPPTIAPTGGPASPSPAGSAGPGATPGAGEPATIVLTQLKLDAADDPEGRDRVVTFTTGGTGAIAIALKTLSPTGSARMCLSADGTDLGCKTTAGGSLAAETAKKAATFVLTLRGDGAERPVVEVSVTFPAASPSVTVADVRFDGTDYPETNGIQAIVQPRAGGGVHVTADWGGHPFIWELDLLEQGGSGSETLANQGPATRMDETLPVTAPNPWKVVLQNVEMGFGPTPMTVTIAWP